MPLKGQAWVPLPSGGNGCRLCEYDELLPEHDVRMLLQLLRLWVLLLHLYGSGLWHREAGDLEGESSQGFTEPAAREELAGGFFAFGRNGAHKCHLDQRALPQGLKPLSTRDFSAWLKPCPDGSIYEMTWPC